METPLMKLAPVLTISATPALNDLEYWWQVRQSDPDAASGYADDAPQSFVELVERIDSGQYLLYLAYAADEVVGALWMHDITRDADGTPRVGWMGTYVLPDHRGRQTTQSMWELTHCALVELGVQSIYWASHYKNTRSHAIAERHLGLHRVAVYPAFTLFDGEPTDCVIFSTYETDIGSAWEQATMRVKQQLAASNATQRA